VKDLFVFEGILRCATNNLLHELLFDNTALGAANFICCEVFMAIANRHKYRECNPRSALANSRHPIGTLLKEL